MEFHPIFYSYKNYLRLTTFILISHIIKQETTRSGDVRIQQNVLSLADLNINVLDTIWNLIQFFRLTYPS